jgi:hypothetical protein
MIVPYWRNRTSCDILSLRKTFQKNILI